MRLDIFLLSALAVWRLTHLLVAEDGPWDWVVSLRRHAGDGFWGELLDCFYCLSLWIAAPFAILAVLLGPPALAVPVGWGAGPLESGPARLGLGLVVWLVVWLALSAAAILLERWSGGDRSALAGPDALAAPVLYHEHETETPDELLREQTPSDRS